MIIDTDGADATVSCPTCGRERRVLPRDWRVSDDDPELATICTPPCPTCGTVECFDWHDEVFLSAVEVPNPRGGRPRLVYQPDPDHPAARHMLLIEEVQRALDLKQRRLGRQRPPYRRHPERPDPDELRALNRAMRDRRGR